MGNASRYWNYTKKRDEIATAAIATTLRNSQPFHVVTHRAIGDIPGCTPAPREHTFRNTTREEAAAITLSRATEYGDHILKYCNGEYGGENGLVEMWAAISMMKPMFGPHGEKL